MITIHHATAKRIASAGYQHEISEEGLVLLKDGQRSVIYTDPKEAGEAATSGTVQWTQNNSNNDGTADDFQEDPPRQPAAEAQEEMEFVRTTSGVMPLRHHARYTSNGGGCADELDLVLREVYTDHGHGLDVAGLKLLGESLGLWQGSWDKLNPGMIRMNLANRIRGWLRNNEQAELTIGAVTGRFGIEFHPAKRRTRKGAAARAAEDQQEVQKEAA